eukprot:13922442-Ditylum_brightwellii.AAC.1
MGGAPARTMHMLRCLLICMAWVPYFLREPMALGTLLATMEKLATYLQEPMLAEFYRAWCQVACVRDLTMLLQPNMMTKSTTQIQLFVEVSQFAKKKATRAFGFASVAHAMPPHITAGAGTLHKILLSLVEKQDGHKNKAPAATKGLKESEKELVGSWNGFGAEDWDTKAPLSLKQSKLRVTANKLSEERFARTCNRACQKNGQPWYLSLSCLWLTSMA